jgi:hypothetical protein
LRLLSGETLVGVDGAGDVATVDLIDCLALEREQVALPCIDGGQAGVGGRITDSVASGRPWRIWCGNLR